MALSWSGRRKILYSGVGFVIVAVLLVVIYQTFFTTAVSCFNGQQDGSETGIDCGGSCSLICANVAHQPSAVWVRAFSVGGTYYTAAAYVQNTNVSAGAKSVHYSFQLFDANNSLVATRDGVINLPPVQTIPIIEPNINVGNRTVTRAFLCFYFDPHCSPAPTPLPAWNKVPSANVPQLRATQQNLSSDGSRLIATITNNSINDARGVTIAAVLFDQDGVARAASKSLIDVPAKGQEPVVFTWPGGVPNIVRAEITVLPSF